MAAVEVPVKVGFGGKSALIFDDIGIGGSVPVLTLACDIKIPVSALIEALSVFQRKHEMDVQATPPQARAGISRGQEFDNGGWWDEPQCQEISLLEHLCKEDDPSPPILPESRAPPPPPPGPPPPPAPWEVPAPFCLSSSSAHGSTSPKPKAGGATDGAIFIPSLHEPTVGKRQMDEFTWETEFFTWETEIAELHHIDIKDYQKLTKWSPSQTSSSKSPWILPDESCLLDFVPTKLTPPHFGRPADARIREDAGDDEIAKLSCGASPKPTVVLFPAEGVSSDWRSPGVIGQEATQGAPPLRAMAHPPPLRTSPKKKQEPQCKQQ